MVEELNLATDTVFPQAAAAFVLGATRELLVGLALRTYAHRACGPAGYLLHEGRRLLELVAFNCSGQRGTTGAMAHAARILQQLGLEGGPGRVAMGASGGLTEVRHVSWWLQRHQQAYQWEEAAPFLAKLPDLCALHGLIKPLTSTDLLAVNRWHTIESLDGRRAVEEILATLALYPGVQKRYVATHKHALLPAIDEVCTYEGYRPGVTSDWSHTAPQALGEVSVECIFRVTSPTAAVMLRQGPLGCASWRWYIADPTELADVKRALEPAGGRPGPAAPPGHNPFTGGGGGGDGSGGGGGPQVGHPDRDDGPGAIPTAVSQHRRGVDTPFDISHGGVHALVAHEWASRSMPPQTAGGQPPRGEPPGQARSWENWPAGPRACTTRPKASVPAGWSTCAPPLTCWTRATKDGMPSSPSTQCATLPRMPPWWR